MVKAKSSALISRLGYYVPKIGSVGTREKTITHRSFKIYMSYTRFCGPIYQRFDNGSPCAKFQIHCLIQVDGRKKIGSFKLICIILKH